MPAAFMRLAQDAARQAGFAPFLPDACLINRYAPGARMSLHQDRDERDLAAPSSRYRWACRPSFCGAAPRSERALRVPLRHGDVLVWGGVDRLRFHGVLPVAPGEHPATGQCRINLTLRKAL
jgi:alkylated DNA repair protein (DNA oxidative demethylase)